MIIEVKMYGAECDNCGTSWYNDHYGWSCLVDQDAITQQLMDDEWHIGDGESGEQDKCYCPKCFTVDDDDVFHVVNPTPQN